MIRLSSLFVVVVVTLAGCEKSAILPACEGQQGSCIGVRVEGNLKGLSYFEVSLDRPTALVKRTPESGSANLDLPVRFAVIPPAGLVGEVNVGLVAFRGTSAVASAQQKITVTTTPVEVVFTLNEGGNAPDLTGQPATDFTGVTLDLVTSTPTDFTGVTLDLVPETPTDFTGVPLDLETSTPTDFTGVPLDLVAPPPADMAAPPADLKKPQDLTGPGDLLPGPPIVVVDQNGTGYELASTTWTFTGSDSVGGPAPTVNVAYLGTPPSGNATLSSPTSTMSTLVFDPSDRQAGTYQVRITVTSQNTGRQTVLDYDVVIKNTLDWIYPFADPPASYPNLGSAAVLAAEDWTGDGTDELVAVAYQRGRNAAADPWTINFRLSMIPGNRVSLPLDPPENQASPGYSYVLDSQQFAVSGNDTRVFTDGGWSTAAGEIPFQTWGGFFGSGRGPSGGRLFFRDPQFYSDSFAGNTYTAIFAWQDGAKPFRVLTDLLNQPWSTDGDVTTTGRMRGADNDTDLGGASAARGGGGAYSANLAASLPTSIDGDGSFPYSVSDLRPPKSVHVMDSANDVLAVRAQANVLGTTAHCLFFFDHGASTNWSTNAYCLPPSIGNVSDSVDFCDLNGDGVDDLIWELRDNSQSVATSTFYLWLNQRPAYSSGPTDFLYEVEGASINGSGIHRLDASKAQTFTLTTTTYYNSLSCVRRHGLAPQAVVRYADVSADQSGPDQRIYYRLTVDTQPHLDAMPAYFSSTMVGNQVQGGDFNGDGILDYFSTACPSSSTSYCGYWYSERGVVIYGRP